jgi:hypothetical protein
VLCVICLHNGHRREAQLVLAGASLCERHFPKTETSEAATSTANFGWLQIINALAQALAPLPTANTALLDQAITTLESLAPPKGKR